MLHSFYYTKLLQQRVKKKLPRPGGVQNFRCSCRVQFVVNYFVFSCDFQLNIFASVQFGSWKLAKIFAHTYEMHSMLIGYITSAMR